MPKRFVKSQRKIPVFNSRVSVCVWVISKVGIRLRFLSSCGVDLERRLVTLIVCIPDRNLKLSRSGRGHFVTLREGSMHIICNPGLNCSKLG